MNLRNVLLRQNDLRDRLIDFLRIFLKLFALWILFFICGPHVYLSALQISLGIYFFSYFLRSYVGSPFLLPAMLYYRMLLRLRIAEIVLPVLYKPSVFSPALYPVYGDL